MTFFRRIEFFGTTGEGNSGNESIRRVDDEHDYAYTMKEIEGYLGTHYATIIRIIKGQSRR